MATFGNWLLTQVGSPGDVGLIAEMWQHAKDTGQAPAKAHGIATITQWLYDHPRTPGGQVLDKQRVTAAIFEARQRYEESRGTVMNLPQPQPATDGLAAIQQQLDVAVALIGVIGRACIPGWEQLAAHALIGETGAQQLTSDFEGGSITGQAYPDVSGGGVPYQPAEAFDSGPVPPEQQLADARADQEIYLTGDSSTDLPRITHQLIDGMTPTNLIAAAVRAGIPQELAERTTPSQLLAFLHAQVDAPLDGPDRVTPPTAADFEQWAAMAAEAGDDDA
jgi:hypothetical protein